MRQLLNEAAGGKSIRIGDILHLFGRRGFAFLILILAMLNILIFMVPFISILFGLPILILSAQIALGLLEPIFPRVLLNREIPRSVFVLGLEKAIFWVQKIEIYVKPRLLFLSSPYIYRVHGIIALILAVMVTMPIPIFNALPSVALAFLSIGLLQRDGVFVVIAYVAGVGCMAIFKSISHAAHILAFG